MNASARRNLSPEEIQREFASLLATAYLRLLGKCTAKEDTSLHQPSGPGAPVLASVGAPIPAPNDLEVSASPSPHASVAGKRAGGDDGDA